MKTKTGIVEYRGTTLKLYNSSVSGSIQHRMARNCIRIAIYCDRDQNLALHNLLLWKSFWQLCSVTERTDLRMIFVAKIK